MTKIIAAKTNKDVAMVRAFFQTGFWCGCIVLHVGAMVFMNRYCNSYLKLYRTLITASCKCLTNHHFITQFIVRYMAAIAWNVCLQDIGQLLQRGFSTRFKLLRDKSL